MAQSYKPKPNLVKRIAAFAALSMVAVVLVASQTTSFVGVRQGRWERIGLPLPDTITHDQRVGIYLRDVPIGSERRVVGTDPGGATVSLRQRELRFLVAGVQTEIDAGSRVVTHADGRREVHQAGPAANAPLPDGFPSRSGPLVFGPPAPAHDPVDLVALLRLPSPPVPRARHTHLGRYRLQGPDGERVIDTSVPLLQELPHTALGPPGGDPALPRLAVPSDRPGATVALIQAVRDRLRATPTPGSGQALLALQRGEGDCDEHAALFVGLAARVGLPARLVSGVVYFEGVAGPGYYLHAWVEVDQGDRWLPADPMLGQPIADATHVPLARGMQSWRALERLEGLKLDALTLR